MILAGTAPLSLADLRALDAGADIALDPAARPVIERSAAVIADIVASGRTVYGVNTGFGALAQTTIPNERLAELQRRLVLSHSAGVGAHLPDPIVRLVMALKIVGLARGHSGVRPVVIEASCSACLRTGYRPLPSPRRARSAPPAISPPSPTSPPP